MTMRLQRSLAGQWQFQLDPEGTLHPASLQPDRTITVPLPWQAALPELERYSGYAWYERNLDLEAEWLTGELLLHFGAVDYRCQVYINGQQAGEHEGGYTAFTLPIRQYIHEGSNTLSIRVYDAAQNEIVIPRWREQMGISGNQVAPEDMPHGKQTWYLDVSGIWQDVTLTAVPSGYIERVHITPNIHTEEAYITVELAGAIPDGYLRIDVADQRSSSLVTITPEKTTYQLTVHLTDALRWTPETPNLYSAVATLSTDGWSDEMQVRFGFREISTENGKLLLNGEPIILLSALDQDFYPETIYTVPSEAYLRDEFEKAKALGLNSLRCHIKPPDPLYLYLADEMGLLIWAEIPSWRTFQPKTTVYPPVLDDSLRGRVRQTLEEMIERDFNHPSLMIWTIVNEDWGTILPLSAADRQWVAEMVDLCKQLDPTRLVVDNSPCGAPWGTSGHIKTDLNDYHTYANIPEAAKDFAHFIEQFSLRPAWSFSLEGDSAASGSEPIILSEFGNWGLPALDEMTREGEPDWFKLGPWWSSWDGDPGFPHDAQKRFHALGLNAIWPDYDSFAEATQWHQFAALKIEIETMRRYQSLAGYVITELTDIYWESNGLLDFYRRPKVYHDQFSQFNTPDVIVPELKRWAYWDDEIVLADLHVSHYSAANWSNAHLITVFGEDQKSWPLPTLARGDVREIGDFFGKPSPVEQTEFQFLKAEVDDGSGQIVAQSSTPILVLPSASRRAAYTQPVYWADSKRVEMASHLADDLAELGYQAYSGDDAQLFIADKVDADILDWVAQGGDLLFLSEKQNPFIYQQGRGGAYSGNWMTSFSWLRPGVYQRLQVTSPLSLPFEGITPQSVFVGLPLTDPAYQRDFLAGQITGWVGHPALHTVQFRYGRGRVIMTSYRLKDNLAQHPAAVAMLHDLIDYLASDACAPALTLKP